MKILQVVTAFSPAVVYGGPSAVAEQQANALVERGHHVVVAASDILELDPPEFIPHRERLPDDVEVMYFPSWLLRSHFSFIVSRRFSEWIEHNVSGFDVVHIHFAREWFPVRAAQIAIREGVPTFLQPHGMLGRAGGVRTLVDKFWVGRLLERASRILVYHDQEEAEVTRIAPRASLSRLPNGLESMIHGEKWTQANLANPVILFLARLHPRKRVLAFVEMARALRNQGIQAHYRIVGPDGGDLERARALVSELKMQDQTHFVGSLKGGAHYQEYSGSAVYVLPSVNEPFPRTVLEALGLGVPTIVTDSCFISPLLRERGAALISQEDPNALAAAVKRILCDAELARHLSYAGRKLMEDELNSDQIAARLERFYEEACAETC